jgi:DNA topoisomerase-2
MIIDKQLTVNNRRKADIVSELRKKEFVPFPKATKQKGAEEGDEEEDEEEAAGAVTDFDYLLGMAIYSLTRERIEKLENQAREKEDELLAMLKRSPQDLWNTDLDRFLDEWEVGKLGTYPRFKLTLCQNDCKEFEAKANDVAGGKKKKQQKTLKTRKSIGFSAKREDDDDFVPIKAVNGAKKKAPAKAGSSRMKDEDDDFGDMNVDEKKPAPKRRIPVKQNLIEDDDEDDDLDDDYGGLSVPKPAAKPAKAKEKEVVEIDDEDSEPVKAPPKKPAVKKPTATKKGSDDESDGPPLPASKKKAPAKKAAREESGSDVEIVASKSKGKAPAKLKRKRYAWVATIREPG